MDDRSEKEKTAEKRKSSALLSFSIFSVTTAGSGCNKQTNKQTNSYPMSGSTMKLNQWRLNEPFLHFLVMVFDDWQTTVSPFFRARLRVRWLVAGSHGDQAPFV